MRTTKSFSHVQIKDAEQGTVEAVFATFDVIDKDGDVTRKGAFTGGASVVMSAYGHGSWDGQLPIGVGTIEEVGNTAVFKGRFFVDTQHGLDAFRTVKQLSEAGLQEWSYSLQDVEAERGTVDGKSVRILKKISVKEVSPVLVGAGVDTRTLAVKSVKQLASSIRRLLAEAGQERWGAGDRYAWVYPCDYDDDAGFAVFSIYAEDDSNRLVQVDYSRTDTSVTLGDTETEVHETAVFLAKAARKGLKFSEHLDAVLADVKALTVRAADVVALRAEKGKTISEESADALAGIAAALTDLKALIEAPPTTTPVDEDASDALRAEFLRFVAISQGVSE